jgi:GPH family glycoside/pentoside/hexuronide:cation symporter
MSLTWRRVLYGVGSFGSSLLQQTVLLWIFYYYAPPAGQGLPTRVSASSMGLAMALGRLIDAIADPPVAYLSDRLRSGRGRRRPFILAGAPLLALAFILLWRPPDTTTSTANFWYVSVVLAAFFFLFTTVLNPYTALLPEISPPGAPRTATAAWQASFGLTGLAVAYVSSGILSSRFGFPTMALILAIPGLAALWIAGFSIRERTISEDAVPFWPALRGILANRRFRIFVVGLTLLWFGLSMVNLSLAFDVTVLMGLPSSAVGILLGAAVTLALLSFPGIYALTKRYGKRATLMLAMGIAAVIVPFIGAIGLIPVPFSHAVQGYALVALAGPPLAALFVLPNAILADIAESHGAATGERSEAMFFAFQGLVFNGTTSLAAATLGGILQWLGYSPENPLGLRVVPVIAAITVAAGAFVFSRYPRD